MNEEPGATAVEYAIMIALIAIVVFSAVVVLGEALGDTYDCAGTKVDAIPGSTEC